MSKAEGRKQMKDFIFISIPWLLAAPLSVFIISAACSRFRSGALAVVSIIIHALAITAIVLLGGGLSDIFVTLLVSVLSSMIFSKKSTESLDGRDGDRE